MSTSTRTAARRTMPLTALVSALVLSFTAALAAAPASAAPIPEDGDTVWIGSERTGYSGTALHHLSTETPADPATDVESRIGALESRVTALEAR